MRWFRFYHEALDDPKVQRLSPEAFRAALKQAIEGKGGPFEMWLEPFNGRPSAAEWAKLRGEVYARDDYTCQYCGERGGKLECDHVIALSRGGSNDISNLKAACFKCNRSKRAKSIEEWRGADVRGAA